MRVHYQGRKSLGLRCQGVLSQLGCEFTDEAPLGFSVLGSHIYTPEEIEATPLGIVNLHLAPLPDYRGFYAFSHSVANGEREYAVTLHYVDEGIDTGPIIATREVPMADTPQILAYRASEAGFSLFSEWAPAILSEAKFERRMDTTPQPEGGRYYDRDSLPPDQRW